MPTIKRCKRVGFSAQEMYDLVNDVARYPDFVPHCCAAHIYDVSDQSMTASLTLKLKGNIQQSFKTHNVLTPHTSIEMHLASGPFKSLHGVWHFIPLGAQSSQIELDLSFAFKSKLTELALNPIFSQLIHSMIDAFVQRAEVVYGKK
tara:strand:+ start:2322 stop:2762 length:441 start_codon:yes stop_codon:yes gene_type:complete